MKNLHDQNGFSLIELMIVVAIIGVLSTIAVPNMSEGIKKNLARNHIMTMISQITPLRITDQGNVPLLQITLSGCSGCTIGARDMRTYVPDATYTAAWARLGFTTPPKDPWGHYYVLDENDEEGGFDCRMDSIWSAGADGYFEGLGSGQDVGGDDIIGRVPYANQINCIVDPITGGHL